MSTRPKECDHCGEDHENSERCPLLDWEEQERLRDPGDVGLLNAIDLLREVQEILFVTGGKGWSPDTLDEIANAFARYGLDPIQVKPETPQEKTGE